MVRANLAIPILTAVAFLFCLTSWGPLAEAQTLLLEEEFDNGGIEEWIAFPDPANAGSVPAFDFDSTPTDFGGDPISVTGLSSLNYNDGIDYYPSGTNTAGPVLVSTGGDYVSTFDNSVLGGQPGNSGTATSPVIDLTGFAAPTQISVTFWHNERTEGSGEFDTMWCAILDQEGDSLHRVQLLPQDTVGIYNADETQFCTDTWHEHTITLGIDPSQIPSIQIQFAFDTIDDALNFTEGMAIDSLVVSSPDGNGSPDEGEGSPDDKVEIYEGAAGTGHDRDGRCNSSILGVARFGRWAPMALMILPVLLGVISRRRW